MHIPGMSIIIDNEKTITLTDLTVGKVYTIRSDHENYSKILKVKSKNEFLDLLNPERYLAKTVSFVNTTGEFQVKNDEVYYGTYKLPPILGQRLLQLIKNHAEDALKSMKAFVSNLMQNPSNRSVEQLLRFLEHKSLGITEDGYFTAYKTVRHDYLDKHSGTLDNTPGKTVTIQRNLVDDDPSSACSTGLHVGSLAYAGPNGSFRSGNDKCVMVKVNPRDVVSVPLDCNEQKMRVCEYLVLCDVTEILEDDTLYSGSGKKKECKPVSLPDEPDEPFFVYADNGNKVSPLQQAVEAWDDLDYEDEDDFWSDDDDNEDD